MLITTAHASSSAAPARLFERWADMATWPEWNTDTEWVRLDGPFVTGTTGRLKPKGGPTVRFTVEELTGEAFVDTSALLGARLTFDHRITPARGGGCAVDVTVTLAGPLSRVWNLILGGGIRNTAQEDLNRLVKVAEAAAAAEAADTSEVGL